jgi:hypothetical protein
MAIVSLFAVLLAGAAVMPSPATTLAGRYSHHFKNGLVDGSVYWSDDVAEIVPVDATHAYVRLALQFYNGHICDITGVAQAQGDALVYQAPPGGAAAGGPPCRLTVRRKGGSLTWDDGETCKADCGARGTLADGSLPWSSRRPITYLARLKASSEYRDALSAWSAAAPSPGR